MTIAASVENYLAREGADYDTLAHAHTLSSNRSAQAAHIPGDRLAKCVVLEDDSGYLMAIVPSTCKVDLGGLHRELNRNLGLATERELLELFRDCELGALPPLGPAYGIDMIIDEGLASSPDIYFEAGDHERLIHMKGSEFQRLMAKAPRARISYHM